MADVWMDAAHRGLAAFSEAEQQPVSAHGAGTELHAPVQRAKARKGRSAASSAARRPRSESQREGGAFASTVAAGETDSEERQAGESLAPRSSTRKKLLVAWTIDDGPGPHTEDMKKIGLSNNRVRNVTWYVQRNRINDENIKQLKKIQDRGGEIAIHSFHPSKDHTAWFPIGGESSVYSFPYGGQGERRIMEHLRSFHRYLRKHCIKPKFVRLPGGLYSELIEYGKHLRIPKDKRDEVARRIIAGSSVESYGHAAKKMASDFAIVKDTLSDLDLLLWGGSSGDGTRLDRDPLAINTQSWMAESSGVGGRTDNVTSQVNERRLGKETGDGVFERIVRGMKKGDTRFLVVLAHDSSRDDANEVKRDRMRMEGLAARNHILLEYHTMSSLYEHATGKDIDTLDVRYK